MESEQQQRILGYFIEEAQDHLNTIEQGLLSLQSTIEDTEIVNAVFRAVHSIKGGAAMLGLDAIQKTAHRLEDFIKILKESPVKVDYQLESLFLSAFDILQTLIEQLTGAFGLTDEIANSNNMSETESVFGELNNHLKKLVKEAKSSSLTTTETIEVKKVRQTETMELATSSALKERASINGSNTEQVEPDLATPTLSEQGKTSLDVKFKRDVLVQLKKMLQLFKQQDVPESRQALQKCCLVLRDLDQQKNLPGWSELIETARAAIAYSQNSYFQLASIVLTEIQQAQELLLAGRAVEIVPSEKLKALVPGLGASELVTASDANNLPATSIDPFSAKGNGDNLLSSMPVSQSRDKSIPAESSQLSADSLSELKEQKVTNQDYPAISIPAEGVGEETTYDDPDQAKTPEVGIAELNSLADIFEGQIPDLEQTWQEEEIINLNETQPQAEQSEQSTWDEQSDLDEILGEIESVEISTADTTSQEDDLMSWLGEDDFQEEVTFGSQSSADSKQSQESAQLSKNSSADQNDFLDALTEFNSVRENSTDINLDELFSTDEANASEIMDWDEENEITLDQLELTQKTDQSNANAEFDSLFNFEQEPESKIADWFEEASEQSTSPSLEIEDWLNTTEKEETDFNVDTTPAKEVGEEVDLFEGLEAKATEAEAVDKIPDFDDFFLLESPTAVESTQLTTEINKASNFLHRETPAAETVSDFSDSWLELDDQANLETTQKKASDTELDWDNLFGDETISTPSTTPQSGNLVSNSADTSDQDVPFWGEIPDSTPAVNDAALESNNNDFADLEAMLADDTAQVGWEATSSAQAASKDEFAALEALLADDLVEQKASAATETEADIFTELDAILTESLPAPAQQERTPTQSADIQIEDEFKELEEMLERAKQMAGPPTNRDQRPAGPVIRRPSPLVEQTMRVPIKHLDSLSNLVGELVVNRNSLEQDQERLRQFLDNLQHQVSALSDVGARMRDLYERSLLESSLLASRQSSSPFPHSGIDSSDRDSNGEEYHPLEMDRFTGFHLLSQEMIELIVQVRESASDIGILVDGTDQVARLLRQVTGQLQEGLTRTRMVPFAQAGERLPRPVRDISMKLGKQAKLHVEGKEVLIDKMILEHLYDPLTHLVNNAITHGIEAPEVRQAANKPAAGQITLQAFQQGNQTVISISDDGAGIDPEVVRKKAIEKKLIDPSEAQNLTHSDLYDFLFHPGFSTKDKADDFSGRGVGMDVVRTSMSEIRGVIHVDSVIGKGTTFTIRLPLTLSICKALCCLSNRARIAFPMDGVEDVLDVSPDVVVTNSEGKTCIRWRDGLMPFQPLSDLLKYNRQLSRANIYGKREDNMISIVVLRSAGNFLAVQVDQATGEQEIVIKQLEGPVPKPVGIAGATVLGDGRIMPIADVMELIDLSRGIRGGVAIWQRENISVPEEPTTPETKPDPMVLIVDDSITVRSLLEMTFTKSGYRVEQARDGQEAWEKLRSGLPCDVVFCDIEMPRMNGIELLSRVQKDEELSQIPIAMLTSRGAQRHQQEAAKLGARGYFIKPYQDDVLLDAAQRMIKGEVLFGNGMNS
ncbi:MAG: response regulator [Coleofasciculaceae cyanobacterium]